MKKIILVLGGVKSGKSEYAVCLAKRIAKRVIFIATATSPDGEMKKRIKLHKASRPRQWKLIEEGKAVSSVLLKLKSEYKLVLVDCLGLFISNLLAEELKDEEIEKMIKGLINAISKVKHSVVLVSNEVGCGIVPDNLLARRFRDLLGLANQIIAKTADEVVFMHSGIPVTIKGGYSDAEIK